MEKGPFDEKNRAGIERQREKNKELGHDLAFGVRTENERINKVVEFNALRDHTLPDPSKPDMVHFPRWKEDQKDRWVSEVRSANQKPFKTALHVPGLDKQKATWEVAPLRGSPGEKHEYKEGLEKLGNDLISKTLDRNKNVGVAQQVDKKHDWVPFARPDVWQSALHVSQSLRTKQMDEVLKQDPVYDGFSRNEFLDHYKQPLVRTGNVDHIVPFQHSQDRRGLKFKQLRALPEQKLYPNSTCNELARGFRLKNTRDNSPLADASRNPDYSIAFKSKASPVLPPGKSPALLPNPAKQTPGLVQHPSRVTIVEEAERPESRDKLGSLNNNTSEVETNRGNSTSTLSGTKGRASKTFNFGRRKHREVKEKDRVDRLLNKYFR